MDVRPPASSETKELFATPILKLVLLSAIIQKVSISLFGAPNIVQQANSSGSNLYHCSYLFDTGCNRVYPCNFSAMAQLKGATVLSERRDDTFSILPSLQNSLQSRKRVGESIKVGCTFSTACSRYVWLARLLFPGRLICLKDCADMLRTTSSSCQSFYLPAWRRQRNRHLGRFQSRSKCMSTPTAKLLKVHTR